MESQQSIEILFKQTERDTMLIGLPNTNYSP